MTGDDECAGCMAGDADALPCECDLETDHLHLRCDQCGYVWTEA